MIVVSCEFLLGPNTFLRVRFEKEGGRVLGFVIQLECLIDGEWHAVIRYDTSHGFAHCDILHPTKDAQKIELNIDDYNTAFAFARQDIVEKWQFYCERYSTWLKEKRNSPKPSL